MRPSSHLLIGLVRAYQYVLSPVLPMSCRYHPTCSHYACDAIARHGAVRGTGLALARVLRCHPWRAGGYDPVPDCATRGWWTALPGRWRPSVNLGPGLGSNLAPRSSVAPRHRGQRS